MDLEGVLSSVEPEPVSVAPAFGEVVAGRDGWLIKSTTEDAYRARVKRLWRSAAERKARLAGELEAPALIRPLDVVEYLKWRALPQADRPALAISTWQSYRSALLWDFSRSSNPEFILACRELEEATHPGMAPIDDDHLMTLPEDARFLAKQQVQRRRQGIPKADLVRLLDQLGGMNRQVGWGARVQYWLQAAIATGLRPGEWEFARWADDSQTLLLAPNLKTAADTPAAQRPRRVAQASADGTSPHRPPTTHRQMRAVPVDPSDRIFVAQHLLAIRQAAQEGCDFENYRERCRQSLWHACRRLWGGAKLYSLNQCRHQFSANARGRLSRDELAAAMGHARRKTASHYAGADRAHSKSPIKQTAHQALTQAMQQIAAQQEPAEGASTQAQDFPDAGAL